MFTSLQIKFLIFIAVVFIITIGFGILIFRQMKKVGQKALEAKQRQQEYQSHLHDNQKIPSKENQIQLDDEPQENLSE